MNLFLELLSRCVCLDPEVVLKNHVQVIKINFFLCTIGNVLHFFLIWKDILKKSTIVRHVTGNDQDYLRKIPSAVVQISALL